jgi:hypothetical protein
MGNAHIGIRIHSFIHAASCCDSGQSPQRPKDCPYLSCSRRPHRLLEREAYYLAPELWIRRILANYRRLRPTRVESQRSLGFGSNKLFHPITYLYPICGLECLLHFFRRLGITTALKYALRTRRFVTAIRLRSNRSRRVFTIKLYPISDR